MSVTPEQAAQVYQEADCLYNRQQVEMAITTLAADITNDMQDKNDVPTREELMEMTATELREILDEEYDITGMDNQPKPFLVEIILKVRIINRLLSPGVLQTWPAGD